VARMVAPRLGQADGGCNGAGGRVNPRSSSGPNGHAVRDAVAKRPIFSIHILGSGGGRPPASMIVEARVFHASTRIHFFILTEERPRNIRDLSFLKSIIISYRGI
jgi:hypothetical protein